MILFTLAGLALTRYAGIKLALPIGVFAGFTVANLVPVGGSCSVPAPPALPQDATEEKAETEHAPRA